MRRTSLGGPAGTSLEARMAWVEQALRSLERASYVNTAEQVSFAPTDTIEAGNVQDAIEELSGDASRLGMFGRSFVTLDALGAGYLVNITSTSGAKVRLADGGAASIPAHGFVTSSYSSGATATVYFLGINTFSKSSSGSTFDAGDALFLSTDGGKVTNILPATGNFNQHVGFCLSSVDMFFFPSGVRDPSIISS